MLKKLITLAFIMVFPCILIAQIHYKINDSKTDIYYENIIDFSDKNKNELIELTKKYLIVNDFNIIYEDEHDIYAIGKFETKYRGWFLMFFNTNDFNCLYDLKLSFKDNKIRYYASNFILFNKSVKINTSSWYSNFSKYGSSAWSTTKIPTEVPRKPVGVHFRAGKTKNKHLLFQDIDKKMNVFEKKLVETILFKEKDW